VPGYCPACFHKDISGRRGRTCKKITNFVVELQEYKVYLSNKQVFVISVITNQSEALRASRKIVAKIPSDPAKANVDVLANEQLGTMLARILRVTSIKMWTAIRPETINSVKAQAWRPKVLNAERVLVLFGKRSQIERDVMIDELS